MPQVLPLIAYYVAGQGTVGFIASLVTSIIVNTYEANKAQQEARDAYNASLKDRLVMTETASAARSRVYGRVRTVDGVLFKATHGADNRYYTLVVALADGEIDGVEQIYLSNDLVTVDGDGYVLSQPYSHFDMITAQAILNVDANGDGTVTLPHTPIDGSVSIFDNSFEHTSNIPFTQSGTNNTVITVDLAPGEPQSLTVNYQYLAYKAFSSLLQGSSARIRAYLGTASQDISSELHDLVGDMIEVGQHKFEGIALLLCTFEYNTDAYPMGVPQVTAVIRGTKVADPRHPSWGNVWTNPEDADGPHPGENPALCALDWAKYERGGNLAAGEYVLDSFVDAANACDVSVDHVWTMPGLGHNITVTEPRYICGMVARTDMAAGDVFGQLVGAMAGQYGWSGGLLRVRAGAWRAPVIAVTEDWVSDKAGITIQAETAPQDTYNVVRATISDASRDYAVLPIPDVPPIADNPYIEADGLEMPLEISLAATTFAYQAMDVAKVRLLESRQSLSCSLPLKLHACNLELFDIIELTIPHYGWSGKTMEVLQWSFTMEGMVQVVFKETVASIYDPDALFTLDADVDNTSLPNPWVVAVPEGLTVSSVVGFDNDQQLVTRTLVTWRPITDPAVTYNGKVEVQWVSLGLAPVTTQFVNSNGDIITFQNSVGNVIEWMTQAAESISENAWSSREEAGSATSSTIIGLRSGYAYLFRIRAINSLQVRSQWSTQQSIIIPVTATSDASAIAAAAAAAAAAQAAADQAAASAANALEGVNDAIDAANAAAASADAATAAIDSLSLDNVLSPVEKLQVIQQYNTIIAEQSGIDAQATAYGITTEKTAYDTAVSALTTYLATLTTPVLWSNTTDDTDIVGTTFRQKFVDVYSAKQTVLNKIAEIAGTRAAWASVSGIPYASIYTNDDSVALGFNPSFAAWTSTYPDGWVNWAGAAPTKETSTVRGSPYAVRYTASATDLGIKTSTASWTTTPMALGTFVAGALDIYLVSRTSGAPGLLVRLFTNAALTTYVETQVQPPSFGVGSWQRVQYVARTGASDRIYGIQLFLMASWSSFTSGAFTGTVIFGGLRLAFFDQSIDNTKISISSGGVLSGAGGGTVTISGLGYSGDLNATYGASATNFTGHIGPGNLVQKSAFRTDANSDGMADGWGVYNNSGGPQPITPTRTPGGGMFGGDAQVVTWSVNNTSTKGIYTANDFSPTGGVVGGWLPNQSYVISFYARASGTNIGQQMQLAWNTTPSSTTTLLDPALTSSFQRYAWRITWGASVEAQGRMYFSISANSLTQGGLSFSAAMVTQGDVLTEYVEAVEDIRLNAVAAQATATQAATDAATALSGISNIASDNLLTSGEKGPIIQDVNVIQTEQAGIDAEANAHAITTEKTNYDNAVAALNTYLATLTSPTAWNSTSGDTTIVGTTFRQKFADVYTTRQTLLNKIANTDLSIANSALTNANAAVATANSAATQAAAANTAISNMSSDNVLTPVEKPVLIQDYTVIISEQAGIDAQATAYGIGAEKANYDTAVTTLTNYLNTLNSPVLWNNLSGNTTIVGTTLRTNFANVYTTRQVLLNRIAAIAGTLAQWSGVYGTGKPQDNATVGATLGSNLYDSTGIIIQPFYLKNNLIDPSWWNPSIGQGFLWALNQTDVGENTIVWGTGPKGGIQALWKCVAMGAPNAANDGGWTSGSLATTPTNAFKVDTTKTYRFVVPVYRETVSGVATAYWGIYSTANSGVCALNTTNPPPDDNPYFAAQQLTAGKWYLMVGYVFPAGATGLDHTGAGIYDMTTGALAYGGTNYNWRAGVTEASTRAYQFYASTGMMQYFAQPLVNLVDGTEPSLRELLSNSALLNSQQQWGDVQGRPMLYRVIARGLFDVQAPAQAGFYNAETNVVIFGATRSYMLLVILRSTGAVVFQQTYDVYGGGAGTGGRNAATLAADLNSLSSQYIVVVYTYDEPNSNRLTSGMDTAMYRCGASRAVFGSPEFKGHSAYIMVGIAGCGEGNGFEARQGTYDGDTNTWCDVTFQVKSGNFIISGTSATPRTLADYSYTGDLNATADIHLIGRNGVVINGNSATKLTGVYAWDADAYSTEQYILGVYVEFSFNGYGEVMAGLNDDPTSDSSYTSINYAWYFDGAASWRVYESNTTNGIVYGTFSPTDVMGVLHDGARVYYLQNGIVRYYHSSSIPSPLFFDSSIAAVGGTLSKIKLVALSAVTGIDTGQIIRGAATEVRQITVPTSSIVNVETVLAEIIYTPTVPCIIELTASWKVGIGVTGSNYGARVGVWRASDGVVLGTSAWCSMPHTASDTDQVLQMQHYTYDAPAGEQIKLRVTGMTGSLGLFSFINDIAFKAVIIKL